MRCEEIRELMSEHIDGVLDEAGEKRLAEHLAECEDCRLDLDALKEAVSLVQGLDRVEPPADLLEKVHARIERDAQKKPGTVWSFLSMTQVRVAIAACFAAVLCLYGVRELSKDGGSRHRLRSETDTMPEMAPTASVASDAAVGVDSPIESEAKEAGEMVMADDAESVDPDPIQAETAKYRSKALGWQAGGGAAKGDVRRGKSAPRRYDARAAAEPVPADALRESKMPEPEAAPAGKSGARKRAEVDGAIWGRSEEKAEKKKARSRSAEPALRPAPMKEAPATAVPEAAVPRSAPAEELERKDLAKAKDGADEARLRRTRAPKIAKKAPRPVAKPDETLDIAARAPAMNAVEGEAGRSSAAKDRLLSLKVVTAKRDEVLGAIRELRAGTKPGAHDGAMAEVKREQEAPADDKVGNNRALKRVVGPTVEEVRMSVGSYAKLVARLKVLGEVTVAGEVDEEPAVDRSVMVGATQREPKPRAGYVTVRVTIFDK